MYRIEADDGSKMQQRPKAQEQQWLLSITFRMASFTGARPYHSISVAIAIGKRCVVPAKIPTGIGQYYNHIEDVAMDYNLTAFHLNWPLLYWLVAML